MTETTPDTTQWNQPLEKVYPTLDPAQQRCVRALLIDEPDTHLAGQVRLLIDSSDDTSVDAVVRDFKKTMEPLTEQQKTLLNHLFTHAKNHQRDSISKLFASALVREGVILDQLRTEIRSMTDDMSRHEMTDVLKSFRASTDSKLAIGAGLFPGLADSSQLEAEIQIIKSDRSEVRDTSDTVQSHGRWEITDEFRRIRLS